MHFNQFYEAFSRIYEQASDKICFVTGSTAGAVDLLYQAPKETTDWTEFLLKTIIAGLAPLLIKKGFDAFINRSTKSSNESNT